MLIELYGLPKKADFFFETQDTLVCLHLDFRRFPSDLFFRFLDSREKSLEKTFEKTLEKTLEKKSSENAPIFFLIENRSDTH